MKVGIITYHFPYNCGATLQCLALQTKLEQLGHEVCVINYRPWYHQNRYTPLKNPIYFAGKRFRDPAPGFKQRLKHAVDGFIRTVLSWRNYPKVSLKEKKFRPFVKRYLHETGIYRTLKQLQKHPPKCDLYISGSDQVWNAAITNGVFDSAYFLNFGSVEIGKMTYSVGADFRNLENPAQMLKDLVKGLDVISMREEKWEPVVREAAEGKVQTHIDVDPTLLLTADQYEQFMPNLPKEPEPYILTYTMVGETQKQIYNGARILSEKTGLKVIDIAGDPNAMNKKVKDNRLCGPDEFLWYIKNAEYVVTNSFHGTVFSVQFSKKFITIPHAQTGNRVTELLDKLGLSERYHTVTVEAINRITNDIDYEAAHAKLDALRRNSAEFLQESVTKYGRKGGK